MLQYTASALIWPVIRLCTGAFFARGIVYNGAGNFVVLPAVEMIHHRLLSPGLPVRVVRRHSTPDPGNL